jgi:hypothetical protein
LKANVFFFDRKPASESSWTQKLWMDEPRTNLQFTLKENTLKRSDLDYLESPAVARFTRRGGQPLRHF